MRKIDFLELQQVKGGVSGWTIVGIVSAIVFLAGVFEGITSPSPCQK